MLFIYDDGRELSRRLRNPDDLAPLRRAIDYDAELDEDYSVSLGDLAETCGAVDALLCLPRDCEKRLGLQLILPALRRIIRSTAERRVHIAFQSLEKWVSGDDRVNLRDAASTVIDGRPHDIAGFWFPDQFDIDAAALRADQLRRKADWSIVSSINYATDEAERIRREEELLTGEEYVGPSGDRYMFDDHPWRIANELIECSTDPHIENAAISANIVSLSPLHALVGKGHSTQYVPRSPPSALPPPRLI